jgi:hypothetical protein
MIKIWIASALMVAAGCLVLSAADDDEPDIFANGTVFLGATMSNKAHPQDSAVNCYTGDQSETPQLVFYPGQTICWWSAGIVTPQGTGPVIENITVAASTPKRTKNFSGSFTICNTSNPNTCDDIPQYTTWTLGVCFGPLPTSFLNKLLLKHGPVPFSSVVTGSGYQSYSVPLSGNSVAPFPQ